MIYLTVPMIGKYKITKNTDRSNQQRDPLNSNQNEDLLKDMIFNYSVLDSQFACEDLLLKETLNKAEILILCSSVENEAAKRNLQLVDHMELRYYHKGMVYVTYKIASINEANPSPNEFHLTYDQKDKLEAQTTEIVEKTISSIIEHVIAKRLMSLSVGNDFDFKVRLGYLVEDYVKRDNASNSLTSLMSSIQLKVLWIGRSLVIDDKSNEELGRLEQIYYPKLTTEQSLVGNGAIMGWGYNLITNQSEETIHNMLDVTITCDYFSSCFYVYSLALSDVMKGNFVAEGYKNAERLLRQLEALIDSLTSTIITYQDLKSYLNPEKQRYYELLHQEWDVDHIFANLEKKISFSQIKTRSVYEKLKSRSERNREMTLAIIAAMSIVGLFISISDYGQSEEGLDDVFGILDLSRSFSPDVLLWISIGIVVMFSGGYLLSLRGQD